MKSVIDEFVVERADQITLVFPLEKRKEVEEALWEGDWDMKYAGPQPGTNMLQRRVIATKVKNER